jgi:hypothetical protein
MRVEMWLEVYETVGEIFGELQPEEYETLEEIIGETD